MTPTIKAAIFSAFSIAVPSVHAQEATTYNFTLIACSLDNHQFSLPIQSQLEISTNKDELSSQLLEQTQILANQLQRRFTTSVSPINEQTTPQEIREIFNQFYSDEFNALLIQYRQGLAEKLPDSHTLNDSRIVTKPIRKEIGCNNTEHPTPNS